MNQRHDVLWLSVSPHLKCFDQRLLSHLVQTLPIRRWEYCQTVDEPCCIDAVVDMLHAYVCDRITLAKSVGDAHYKVHLIGHGVSGIVGLFYARRYPQHVASLTLLSVGVQPAVNWQAHYYALRKTIPCSREIILGQMARLLFGQQPNRFARAIAKVLANDLDSSISLHSLARSTKILPGGVDVPLLVCNGAQDAITVSHKQNQWQPWMKVGDRLWDCPEGRHFFHFYHAPKTAKKVLDFWSSLSKNSRHVLNNKAHIAKNRATVMEPKRSYPTY